MEHIEQQEVIEHVELIKKNRTGWVNGTCRTDRTSIADTFRTSNGKSGMR